jgi:Serine aminopeptidase, S33
MPGVVLRIHYFPPHLCHGFVTKTSRLSASTALRVQATSAQRCPGSIAKRAAATRAGARSSSPSSACLSPPRFARLCTTTMASVGTPCTASNVRSLTSIRLRLWVTVDCVASALASHLHEHTCPPYCRLSHADSRAHTHAQLLLQVYPSHTRVGLMNAYCSRHDCSASATVRRAVFKRWAAAGVASASYDVHGHGRSEPKEDSGRVTLRDFQHVVDDARQHLLEVAEPLRAATCPHAPLFLCGASMGGGTVRRCRWCTLRRAALTSEMLACAGHRRCLLWLRGTRAAQSVGSW